MTTMLFSLNPKIEYNADMQGNSFLTTNRKRSSYSTLSELVKKRYLPSKETNEMISGVIEYEGCGCRTASVEVAMRKWQYKKVNDNTIDKLIVPKGALIGLDGGYFGMSTYGGEVALKKSLTLTDTNISQIWVGSGCAYDKTESEKLTPDGRLYEWWNERWVSPPQAKVI